MTSPLNERDSMLAGEYALGVLDDKLRQEATNRYENDLAFRHEVDSWSERFIPLLDAIEDQTPSSKVWRNIEKAIAPAPLASKPWWQKLFAGGLLGPSFAGAMAVVVVVVGVGYLPQFVSPNSPALTATLTGEAAPAAMVASYDPGAGTLSVTTNMQAADGHDHELWVIAANEGAQPVSMGIVAPTGTASLEMSDELRQLLAEGAILAISVEPDGGSPTGQPTGPVIATGILSIT